MIIKINKGLNMRLPGYETPEGQALILQNYDMSHNEILEQIQGSVKYHGATLGTNAPTSIMVNYNELENKQDVLVAVDDTVLKKNFGSNEFENLLGGFTPNSIKQALNLENKTYIAAPFDGLFEYDGVSVIAKVNDIKLRDIIYSKETNRCFGIQADNDLVWTDDLATMGGVPLLWAGTNASIFPPTKGDIPEKLWILNGRLVILKTDSIWFQYILGGPTDWRPEKLSFPGGCIAAQTVRQVGQELWFLGFSAETGRGVYGVNGSGEVRLLSYDVEPFLDRINYHKIKDAVAEHVNNIYKISFAIDASLENDYTLHFDTININKDTGSPNIYGPHTYGFSASTVLNTTKFRGEHLFARKHSDGARIFKVANYRTQYSDELSDNGSLIPTILLTGIISTENYKGGSLDDTWFKRYSNLYLDNPPLGTWYGTIEILKGFENETFTDYKHYMEGFNLSIEALSLGSDPLDFQSLASDLHRMEFVSDAIQIKVSNYIVNVKTAFRSIRYDVTPDRRKKNVELVQI